MKKPRALLCLFYILAGTVALESRGADSEASVAGRARISIVDCGARTDATAINTNAIQATIDRLAANGGGTVVVPRGIYITGALFFKPGVNLYLEKDAVLKCSVDMKHFPKQRTRIEGHFEEEFNPGLINADGCDGFGISGEGTLDGGGRPIWDEFWRLRNAAPDRANFRNLSVERARLCIIQNSSRVKISGVTFKDSQFWNLHLYKCRDVLVEHATFRVPDDYRQAPSSDGIDIDSSQGVTIDGCTFSVTDDCVALKGSKGPHALEDRDSPPVEHIVVRNCIFKRGHGALTLGSEATIVRDVIVSDCKILGPMAVLCFKLRPDTPQHYEDIHFSDLTLDAEGGALVSIAPWKQYFNLKGEPPPQSTVDNVSIKGARGRFGAFGSIRGNPGQTEIRNMTFENIDVTFAKPELDATGVANLVRR